jgi:GNAT superfamily N-acetyltransferase
MNALIQYQSDKASAAQIAGHVRLCDSDFVPPLSGRVEIVDYANKIAAKATRFEAWVENILIGLVAVYCNDPSKNMAYITSVSVLKEWAGKGIATCLLGKCVEHAKVLGIREITLEVAQNNEPAIRLYRKSGFTDGKATGRALCMNLIVKSGEDYEQ